MGTKTSPAQISSSASVSTLTMPLLAAPIKPKRSVYALRLSAEALEELTKLALDNHGPNDKPHRIHVSLGSQAKLTLGNVSFNISSVPEGNSSEVYRSSSRGLELVGLVTHKLIMKSELDHKTMGRMKERTKQAQQERSGRTTILLDRQPDSHGAKSKIQQKTVPDRSSPSSNTNKYTKSTSLQKGAVTNLTPTASDIQDVTIAPALVQKVSLRRRAVQMLALEPMHFDKLVNKLSPPTSDKLKGILNDVAKDTTGQNVWTLRAAAFRGIAIEDWRNYTSSQRSIVMFNARDAYDALKLPLDAPERIKIEPIKGKVRPPRTKSNTSASVSSSSASSPASDDASSIKPGVILKTNTKKPTAKNTKVSAASAPISASSPTSSSINSTIGSKSNNPTNGTKSNNLKRTKNNTKVNGTNINNTINGKKSNDKLNSTKSNDKLNSTKSNDKLNSTKDNDDLNNIKNNDNSNRIKGNGQFNNTKINDDINGTKGNDVINGTKSNDDINSTKNGNIKSSKSNDNLNSTKSSNDNLNSTKSSNDNLNSTKSSNDLHDTKSDSNGNGTKSVKKVNGTKSENGTKSSNTTTLSQSNSNISLNKVTNTTNTPKINNSNNSLKRKASSSEVSNDDSPISQQLPPAKIQKIPKSQPASTSRSDSPKRGNNKQATNVGKVTSNATRTTTTGTSTAYKRKSEATSVNSQTDRISKQRRIQSATSPTSSALSPSPGPHCLSSHGHASSMQSESSSSPGSDVPPRNRPASVPRITTRKDYLRYRTIFGQKHREYLGLLDSCKRGINKAKNGMEPNVGDIRKWVERYNVLHDELGLLKAELWRASREEHIL